MKLPLTHHNPRQEVTQATLQACKACIDGSRIEWIDLDKDPEFFWRESLVWARQDLQIDATDAKGTRTAWVLTDCSTNTDVGSTIQHVIVDVFSGLQGLTAEIRLHRALSTPGKPVLLHRS